MGKNPVALISGVSGQDGSYLAEYLISKGYVVFGITRDPATPFLGNIRHLSKNLKLIYSSYQLHHLIEILRDIQPTEIYNLAGQSYVSKSWEMVEDTIQSQGVITSKFLEAILLVNPEIRFLNASSSEIFNPAVDERLNENSSIQPYNPYGCSKSFGHLMVDAYRYSKNLYAVNAILFPHESPRRHNNFAFKKIINAVVQIKNKTLDKLELGNLDVYRDWGYAPQIVSAMHRMLSAEIPENLCLCTGNVRSLREVVSTTFSYLGMDWRRYTHVQPLLVRPKEPLKIYGDPAKALRHIGWEHTLSFDNLVTKMTDFEMKLFDNRGIVDFSKESPIFI
jgi:GDPmannose 4,6-dehydratase